MKRLLVGFDGSEQAVRAVARAAELAAAIGGSVTVLTAAADRLVRGDGVVTPALDEERATEVAQEGARLAREGGAPAVETRISLEAPDDALTLEAGNGYDLVVVGHRSRNPIEEMFLGSTAKSVVDRAPCSVLVVR